jgi:hypothetical protein
VDARLDAAAQQVIAASATLAHDAAGAAALVARDPELMQALAGSPGEQSRGRRVRGAPVPAADPAAERPPRSEQGAPRGRGRARARLPPAGRYDGRSRDARDARAARGRSGTRRRCCARRWTAPLRAATSWWPASSSMQRRLPPATATGCWCSRPSATPSRAASRRRPACRSSSSSRRRSPSSPGTCPSPICPRS